MTRSSSLRAPIAGAVAVVYLLWNLVAWYVSAPAEMGDTYRYFGFLVFDPQNPGITTSFLYQSVQDTRMITLIQVVLATCAFLLLVWAVLIQTRWRAAGIISSTLVLLVSMTTPFWSWQTLLATEGLTLSFSVMWLAAVILSFNREPQPTVAITALSVRATSAFDPTAVHCSRAARILAHCFCTFTANSLTCCTRWGNRRHDSGCCLFTLAVTQLDG